MRQWGCYGNWWKTTRNSLGDTVKRVKVTIKGNVVFVKPFFNLCFMWRTMYLFVYMFLCAYMGLVGLNCVILM